MTLKTQVFKTKKNHLKISELLLWFDGMYARVKDLIEGATPSSDEDVSILQCRCLDIIDYQIEKCPRKELATTIDYITCVFADSLGCSGSGRLAKVWSLSLLESRKHGTKIGLSKVQQVIRDKNQDLVPVFAVLRSDSVFAGFFESSDMDPSFITKVLSIGDIYVTKFQDNLNNNKYSGVRWTNVYFAIFIFPILLDFLMVLFYNHGIL